MYGIIRFFVGLFCSFLLLVFLKKRSYPDKARRICTVLFFLLLTTTLNFFPVENTFWTFKTPEQVFAYRHFGNSKIKVIMSGEEYDLIIGTQQGSDLYDFVPKTEEGWKIGLFFNQIEETTITEDGLFLSCYSIRNGKDHFLTIGTFSSTDLAISDSEGSVFAVIDDVKESYEKGKPYQCYGAYIGDLTEPYYIKINGVLFTLDDFLHFVTLQAYDLHYSLYEEWAYGQNNS